MAELINLAGTTSHSFTIGEDGVTTYHGKIDPSIEIGKPGDIYIQDQTEILDEHGEDTGEFRPYGKVFMKLVVDGVEEWKPIKNYTFDTPIINEQDDENELNNYRISLKQADNNTKAVVTSTKTNDYEKNHDDFGVTRYAADTEVIPSSSDVTTFLNNYKTYDTTAANFPKIYDNYSPDKFIAETPNQIASNIEIEMKRALKTEGKLNNLTTRTKNDLVSAINELDADVGTVSSAMTAGTALGGKTISTGANTDITVANALSTLNTKAGVLTSLTTDEKNTLVGAINEVDSHADTNTTNIGSVTTPMATGTALAGKTIATGNNTDITVANALSTLNTAVKTNKDNIGDLGNLDTAANNLVEAINTEATTRSNADSDLQNQIDAIVSKSDVVDVVSCYNRGTDTSKTDIVHYNTSTLGDNDVIKVLIDETHDNATTYYRWDTATSQFEYIGPEGSYYTKAEADNRFVNADGDTMTGTLTLSSTGGIDATAGSITVPTQQQTDNSTKAASTAYVRTAISNEDALVVHLAGAETITGNKTFGSGTTTTVSGSISLGNNATAKTQASNDSSTKVATTAWVNDTNNNVVHKTNDETVNGVKTFTSNILRTAALGAGGTPIFQLNDSNNKGKINQVGYYVNSTLYNRLNTLNTASGKEGYIEVQHNDNGSFGAYVGGNGTNLSITKVSNSTSDTCIPTMGWVNNPAASTNVVHRTGDESIAGTKTFTGTIAATGATVNVATQTRGDSSNKAASTAFVADGLSLKVNIANMPAISSGTAGQVIACPESGNNYVWKTVRDITTLGGLDDTAVDNEQNDQSLVFDTSVGEGGAWVNKRPTVAVISYW